ncbi:MAG: 4-hydroxythreonine-4-phosphate dehydrogenase PdxA [Paludibacteraceae bacterium]|nr:4-hydroxythreonine-4-phosphate dehydrogenase PdxA [Paludibacteraceae bacterium]
MKYKIGITQGDINGIGYEVMLKALTDPHIMDICTPVIYGSAKAAAFHKKAFAVDSYTISVSRSIDDINPNKVNIINTSDEEPKVEFGTPSAQSGMSAFTALQAATNDLLNNKLDAIVTCPINKATIQNDSFRFPGHTEYFESLSNIGAKALMMLCHGNIRVALVTNHLPLTEIAGNITTEAILSKLTLLNDSLKRDFHIIKPRIAVLGLNPHTGENGLLGTQENDIIIPAIKQALSNGILCFGPLAADGLFGSSNYKKYDAVLAMYHDQGLAPFKAITNERGVNFTAGLPFVRTSPAHGTGYDIAGRNLASPLSMRDAIYAAIQIVRNRRAFDEMNANPLPFPEPEQKRYERPKPFDPAKADALKALHEAEKCEGH